ncbi:MAG: DNA-3-methyladenine glycosylase 2 family protein [Hyphomicrobiaceae bacterium]|nr:DNA-3-methyladenine glycosylase 2 family protein [Hyphomicrobiaceae bacterium]
MHDGMTGMAETGKRRVGRRSDITRPKDMAYATLETMADVHRGVAELTRVCPLMKRLHDEVGDPPLRRLAGGFPGLARIVVGQQLSVASAQAIWQRLEAAVVPFDPPTLCAAPAGIVQGAGLSAAKIRTLHALAEAFTSGRVCADRLERASEAEVRATLCAVPGIGPWTADIYIMFCLGRADAFAPGDLALQEGARIAVGRDDRPSAAELGALAEVWRPWRTVAACLIWHAYAHRRAR